ncbi:SDR family NAD(P)-dependent oxidoreductase [Pandoraea apista]|uniref:SDR family NAD(P)-dependent oxidoreductase n=1 Tax=Pandoraea apista TaxID=93218 RepID=UPI00058A7D4F|nr:glucose 1-dehydrogenase [Pandoraea apista]AJE99569.1 short-chain dehydrogenase [Pandoraea apista]AKH73689.1 short-chain dehydrogenase [Pandoraea apista]AKI62238.1 short-chain dehydrogenase [Pandoraea apista]
MNDFPSLVELAGPIPIGVPAARLAGRVCLVMGGTSGIGRATALRMAQEGARAVIVTGRRKALGDALSDDIRRLGAESLFVAADLTCEADIVNTITQTMTQFGRLDAVFNNAGFQEPRARLADQTDAVYSQVFDTNVRAVFHAMRHEIPALLASGGGTLVNNTSVSGVRNPNAGLALYGASKAALNSLTRAAAMEYAPAGIRINAVAPGRVVTAMMLASGIADMRSVAAGLPLRRMGHPEEVAAAVVWLTSSESSYVVGHVLAADGGFLAG